MNYNISSDKFQFPLLKPILEKLIEYFSEMDIQFYVIGATARDIIMSIHNEKSGRATRDLDIAIAISDWDAYKKVEDGIIKIDGFEKDKKQKQRFIYLDNFELDIVPFGDIMKQDDKIFWPPDETTAMSVLGFSEVSNFTEGIVVDDNINIEVASLEGIFILKIVAWNDRYFKNNKDADDIAFIINNYFSINAQRAAENHFEDIISDEDFTERKAGAKLLGVDISKMLSNNSKTKNLIAEIIENEIAKEEDSILINQILETHSSFNYEETIMCLRYFNVGININ